MSTKGTQFTRVLNYFREADTLEADSCLTAAARILAERKRTPATSKSRAPRTKAAKPNSGAVSTGATEAQGNV